MLDIICTVLRVGGIRFVDAASFREVPATRLESLFQRQWGLYYQYLAGEPRFDSSQALDALRNTPVRCPYLAAELGRRMVQWYVDSLNQQTADAPSGH